MTLKNRVRISTIRSTACNTAVATTGHWTVHIRIQKQGRRFIAAQSKRGRTRPGTNSVMSGLFSLFIVLLHLSSSAALANPNRISADIPIIVGANEDFAPFEFINPQGDADGFSIELMKAVARNEGLNIQIRPDNWSITRNSLKNREIHSVTSMMYSAKRDAVFDFSIPYAIVSYMIFARKGSDIRAINDLKEKEVILVEDVFAYDWITENRAAGAVIPVKDTTEAFNLLGSGKHDCAVLPRLHGLDRLGDLGIETIETIGPPILDRNLCFAVARGDADLLAELNEGLFAIQRSGQYDDIYLKWFSVHEHEKRFGLLAKMVVLFILFGVFGLLCIFVWNRSLKRKVAQKTDDLLINQMRLKQIVEGIPIAAYVIDGTRTVTHWNKACESLTGLPADTIIGTKKYRTALFEDQTETAADLLMSNTLTQPLQRYGRTLYKKSQLVKDAYETECYIGKGDDRQECYYVTAALLRDQTGRIDGAIETWQDVTPFKQLENQLIQSQKLEAIGTLAGGIAHDFNNILSAIIGYTEIAMAEKAGARPPIDGYLANVLAAGLRAKELIQQILAFSHQHQYEKKPIQVGPIVKEVVKLIRASLPANIEIRTRIGSEADTILGDPVQIHQVLMNLCTNAGHAMRAHGGLLEITSATVHIDIDPPSHRSDMAPSPWVGITVADNGPGMAPSIRSQIFNPFFTTKPKEEGTGLGLSVVHGIVTEHGGRIHVESQPGEGTTFQILLPLLSGIKKLEQPAESELPTGNERILVVDDEKMIAEAIKTMLERLGYKVTAVTGSERALDCFKQAPNGFDLVITDQTMPGMTGDQLALRILEIRPKMPIILCTGFSHVIDNKRAEAVGIRTFIRKPVIRKDLAVAVRRAIDRLA